MGRVWEVGSSASHHAGSQSLEHHMRTHTKHMSGSPLQECERKHTHVAAFAPLVRASSKHHGTPLQQQARAQAWLLPCANVTCVFFGTLLQRASHPANGQQAIKQRQLLGL